jgi:hypothetical protein
MRGCCFLARLGKMGKPKIPARGSEVKLAAGSSSYEHLDVKLSSRNYNETSTLHNLEILSKTRD